MRLPGKWPAILVSTVAAIGALSAFRPAGVPVVRILATDYAYIDVPATVRPGLTYFSFKNVGRVRHEMSLLRLEPGITVDTILAKAKTAAKGRGKDFKTVGLLIEPPGDSTIGWLAMKLKRGEIYMLVCTLRDKPDAPQHAEMGMYSAFTVK